ncbi:MAG TPA: phosphate-starvation-inducible PsiE family protein [Actinomycetota bacterium]|nr:phosphate-starvation-inducible PsiE family protein [Actinomycetota bacterium]
MAKDDKAPRQSALGRATDRGMHIVEDVIYTLIGVLLAVGATVLLVQAATELVAGTMEDPEKAVRVALETLLLTFILVELLSAVRTTLIERKLVAEPFLLVGMIATIKAIVVLTLEAKDHLGKDQNAFQDSVLGIGIMGLLLVALAVATLLVRRKEREPAE